MEVDESPEKGGGLGSVFHPHDWTWRWSLDQGWPLVLFEAILWLRMASFTIYSWLRFLSAGIDSKWEGAPMPDLKYNLLFWFELTRGQVFVWFLSWRGVSHVRQEEQQQLWPMLDTDCAADLTHLMPVGVNTSPFTGEKGCRIRQFAQELIRAT